ncbi:MAG TPA: hypothetical protein VGR47_13415 [Terracidiphilus sp.]|nr:hypothetical protein [Terracidiphilus sp.]
MASTVQHAHETEKGPQSAPIGQPETTLVLEELDRILESRFFKNAGRSRQFLEFVVRHKLEGHAEQLKERTIGTEVFQRVPGYATGEDPVVRVQAGEVRRRLERYYESLPAAPDLRIELQPGSYSPSFHWRPDNSDSQTAPANGKTLPDRPPFFQARPMLATAFGIALAAVLVVAMFYARHRAAPSPASAQAKFWGPVLATPQPVFICLAKGVTYRPGIRLYRMYAQSHPGKFQTEVERSNDPLPLDAKQQIAWGDMELYSEYGVADGDVSAALDVSSFLGKIGKPLQVRIGSDYSFEDLRQSPTVIIGAFNNKWTMQLTSGLHFAFIDTPQRIFLFREQVPGGRVWRQNVDGSRRLLRDYGVVSRLLESRTGQFTVTLAGLGANGTEAAAEFVTNESEMEAALKNAPRDWQTKNLQIVLQTDITDSVPGPPNVVAAYYW